MKLNYLAFAVPLFTGFMMLEYYLSSKKERKTNFHIKETIANINVGIAERLSDLFTTGLFYFFFTWMQKNFALFDIQPDIITWILLFLFTDFMWYWYHRFGHEVNLFWAVHVVHHQSDDFNFTVSARITVLQAIARCIFWSVLPLIGFPAEMITVFLLIHGTYPFFTHTQLVRKLGLLEYLLVTPSHHRVHHSSNPQYLDKNYGDVLIIWDKIFGTFAEEKEKPVYGLTKPLSSYSFLWQHFHFMLEIIVAFKRAKGYRQKWNCLVGKPDNIDPRIREYLERKLSCKRQGVKYTETLVKYIQMQTIISLTVLFCVILFEHYLNNIKISVLSFYILLSVIIAGAMLEQIRWVFHLEFARFTLLGLFAWLTFPYFNLSIFLILLLLIIMAFYKTIGARYYSYLYCYKT